METVRIFICDNSHLIIDIYTSMSQSEQTVDFNVKVTLMKVPTTNYPEKEDVFQVKYGPPPPTDQIKEGHVAVKNMFISVDATNRVWISGMKTYIDPIKPGDIMKGMGVSQVIFSNSKKHQVGDIVLGLTYWQKYSVLDGKTLTKLPKDYPNYQNFLGVLGVSGLTAYFGLEKIGNLKKGQSVIISTAAGAVGQIAVQLAKLAGCTVLGITGSDQKCKHVKSLGADFVINYKKQSLKQKIREYFPKGVDVYFDNVGGEMLDEVLMNIKDQSRIIACGTISEYNQFNSDKKEGYRLKNYSRIIIKRAIIQGFLYFDYAKEYPEAIVKLNKLISQGKLKYSVDLRHGVQQCPRGLKDLLTGKNTGKVIIKVQSENIQKPKL